MAQADPAPAPVYSRWRAGATSFGGLGRLLVTLLVLGGVALGYPLARGGMFVAMGLDLPGTGFLLLYTAFAIPIAAFALVKIWRRTRVA